MKKSFKNNTQLLSATKSGFTMVEFSIATAAIAVILIAIAIVTSNVISIYQKGVTIKAVNSVGRGLIDELTSAINSAPSVDTTSLCNSHLSSGLNSDIVRSACKKDKAYKFIFQQKVQGDIQHSAVFCTGNYSYIWNTKDGLDGGSLSLRYSYYDKNGNIDTTTISGFRLIRFDDPTYRACSSIVNDEYESTLHGANTSDTIDITTLATGTINIITPPVQGFLNAFDLDLVLYQLIIFPISQDDITLRTFMSGTFTLGTDRGIDFTRSAGTTKDYCTLGYDASNTYDDDPDNTTSILNPGSEFNYCSINKFNFAARTAGL